MQVVILAGGMGTRLRAVTGDDLPKPLVPINGRPLLDYQLHQIAQAGIRDVVLLTGYGGEQIRSFCGDGSAWGLDVRCVPETVAAGTAGAVLRALDSLDQRFLVLYGDTVFDFDMRRMWAYHDKFAPAATLFLHPNDHPHDSDLVEVDEENRVVRFHPYPHRSDANLPNLVNAGIYILERSALLDLVGLPAKPDFGRHLFPLILAEGARLMGYRSPEYVKDAGTPERLERTARDLLSGRVAAGSLRQPAPAVFLDRDGTLNVERNHIRHPEDLSLLPGVGGAVARLNRSIYRTALITNQPVIARGECDEAGLQLVHNRLETLLGAEGAYLDALYYCPHHPDAGFTGERADLKIACECRKPGTELIRRAQNDLNLDLAESWMIGDTTTDVMTARQSGLRSILVYTGEAGRDRKWPCLPDFECPSIVEAVDLILRLWPWLRMRASELAQDVKPGSVILIGGKERTGKSTLAACLASVLREHGLPTVVIPLDSWLLNEDRNHEASPMERFNLDAARAFIAEAKVKPSIYRIPRHDDLQLSPLPDVIEIDVPAEPIVIVEGVAGLVDAPLRAMASQLIYVKRPEEERLRNVIERRRQRGWGEHLIAKFLHDRESDEALIEDSSKFADAIIEEAHSDCL